LKKAPQAGNQRGNLPLETCHFATSTRRSKARAVAGLAAVMDGFVRFSKLGFSKVDPNISRKQYELLPVPTLGFINNNLEFSKLGETITNL